MNTVIEFFTYRQSGVGSNKAVFAPIPCAGEMRKYLQQESPSASALTEMRNPSEIDRDPSLRRCTPRRGAAARSRSVEQRSQ
eukprot:5555261-Pleurochrysis_carterae.AAC.1